MKAKRRKRIKAIIFTMSVLLLVCCKKEIATKRLDNYYIKEKLFSWDRFIVNDIDNNIFIDSLLTNLSNDTIYLYDELSDYNKIWTLGVLEKSKTTTLSNDCGNSTIISHLVSKSSVIDTLQNEKLYMFRLLLGTNGDIEAKELRRNMLFSRKGGIITLIKNDTIIFPPFY